MESRRVFSVAQMSFASIFTTCFFLWAEGEKISPKDANIFFWLRKATKVKDFLVLISNLHKFNPHEPLFKQWKYGAVYDLSGLFQRWFASFLKIYENGRNAKPLRFSIQDSTIGWLKKTTLKVDPKMWKKRRSFLGGGFKEFLFSPRKLGNIFILTDIFQMGWNHQPVLFLRNWKTYWVLMGTRNPVNSPVEVGSLSHYLQDFTYLRWCRISSVNSSVWFSRQLVLLVLGVSCWMEINVAMAGTSR